MREVAGRVKILLDCVDVANGHEAVADKQPIDAQVEAITELTRPSSPFSLAARSKLYELGLAELVAKPEADQAMAA